MPKELSIEKIALNIGWVKRKAELNEIQFKQEVELFARMVKNGGAKVIGLDQTIILLNNLYSNYHSLLAVAQMIEEGTP